MACDFRRNSLEIRCLVVNSLCSGVLLQATKAEALLRAAGIYELALETVEYACAQMRITGWSKLQHFIEQCGHVVGEVFVGDISIA